MRHRSAWLALVLALAIIGAPALGAASELAAGARSRSAFVHRSSLARALSYRALALSDIPGSPAVLPLAARGRLDAGHWDDVYQITASSENTLVLSLYADDGTDFDLYVFGPSATTVEDPQAAVASSHLDGESFEEIAFKPTETGTYYIDVFRYSGSGYYDLYGYEKGPDPDGEPPGIPFALPGSVSDSVGGVSDVDDVYQVHLENGQILKATVGIGTSMLLFEPGSPSVDRWADGVVASPFRWNGLKLILYAATTPGDHFINIGAGGGVGGPYTLNASILPSRIKSSMSIKANASRIKLRRAVTLSGALSPGYWDACKIELKGPKHRNWTRIKTLECDTRGAWSYKYTPKARGAYSFRATYAGGSTRKACVSRTVAVRVY